MTETEMTKTKIEKIKLIKNINKYVSSKITLQLRPVNQLRLV